MQFSCYATMAMLWCAGSVFPNTLHEATHLAADTKTIVLDKVCLGCAFLSAGQYTSQPMSMFAPVNMILCRGAQGLDALTPSTKHGSLARPRRFEIGAALNRLRSVQMEQRP